MKRFLGIIGFFAILFLSSCEKEPITDENAIFEMNSTDDGEVDPGRGEE